MHGKEEQLFNGGQNIYEKVSWTRWPLSLTRRSFQVGRTCLKRWNYEFISTHKCTHIRTLLEATLKLGNSPEKWGFVASLEKSADWGPEPHWIAANQRKKEQCFLLHRGLLLSSLHKPHDYPQSPTTEAGEVSCYLFFMLILTDISPFLLSYLISLLFYLKKSIVLL